MSSRDYRSDFWPKPVTDMALEPEILGPRNGSRRARLLLLAEAESLLESIAFSDDGWRPR
jgi:hypothetical protein